MEFIDSRVVPGTGISDIAQKKRAGATQHTLNIELCSSDGLTFRDWPAPWYKNTPFQTHNQVIIRKSAPKVYNYILYLYAGSMSFNSL